jgi:heterodisulfide reductase subunit C
MASRYDLEEGPVKVDPIDERFGPSSGMMRCMQCGKCSASCPAALLFDDFSPRDVMLRAMKGEIESLVMGMEASASPARRGARGTAARPG